jgi:hypothetical protein
MVIIDARQILDPETLAQIAAAIGPARALEIEAMAARRMALIRIMVDRELHELAEDIEAEIRDMAGRRP